MNIYKISQTVNSGYDTFDSAVVFAPTITAARHMSPRTGEFLTDQDAGDWTNDATDVTVEYLGVARAEAKAGVITASFNAG